MVISLCTSGPHLASDLLCNLGMHCALDCSWQLLSHYHNHTLESTGSVLVLIYQDTYTITTALEMNQEIHKKCVDNTTVPFSFYLYTLWLHFKSNLYYITHIIKKNLQFDRPSQMCWFGSPGSWAADLFFFTDRHTYITSYRLNQPWV